MLILEELDLKNKRVLIRVDLNVPLQGETILDDSRLQRVLPTIRKILDQKASIILVSHLGDPEKRQQYYSLAPICHRLSALLNHPIRFETNWINGVSLLPGEIVMVENVRFLPGETKNDETLSQQMAQLCDVFVMEAFSCAHRQHSSIVGLSYYAPLVVAGPLFVEECQVLSNCKKYSVAPRLAMIGGAKSETKIPLLHSLLEWIDSIMIGGGVAYPFLKAIGIPIHHTLVDDLFVLEARKILKKAVNRHVPVLLPIDVMVQSGEHIEVKDVTDLIETERFYDVGPKTLVRYAEQIRFAQTILWNGPIGWFENPHFSHGTSQLVRMISESQAYSLAGGGETLSAIQHFGKQNFSYLSTGGAAFLAYLQEESLPVIRILKERGAL